MKTFFCVFAVTLLVVTGTGDAFADAEAGQGYFSIMGSYIDDDDKRGVDDEFNGLQMGLGYAVSHEVNFEAMLSMASTSNPSEEHLGLGIDLQRVFRRDERFSPYLHAGIGYFKVDPAGSGVDRDDVMWSFGVGFLLDMFNSNVALRGEYRHRLDAAGFDPEFSTLDDFSDDIFSIGLQIPFGPATPKFTDSDGDGVADGIDRCPNTPAGAPVDSYGCELDSDGDGVKDSMDKCPGTPRGVAVNADGCPMDSDGDGVTDDKDKCPNTVAGAKVDADGCELDGDKDGVVDRLDECPNSAPGVQVDIRGCEIKAEIRLPGVNFQSNSDRLLPGATSVLDDAVATLKKNPTIKVEVAGHTDSDGAADYNEGLSARRAKTVRDYLAANGIATDRLTIRGYGETQPVADNGTREGKAQNRRVVLRILER